MNKPEPTLYTFDNGEYVQKLDILYPPDTVFYVQDGDGDFVPDGNVGLETTQPNIPQEITLEYMIEKSTEFLRANGYIVTTEGDPDTIASFKNQISQLKDQLAATQKPVKPGDRSVEASIRFAKMRSMIGSHFPTHALQEEANKIISELEAYF